MRDEARRHFYGAVIVVLGAWEMAAFAGAAPTITSTMRRHKALRPVWLGLMAGAVRHLWSE